MYFFNSKVIMKVYLDNAATTKMDEVVIDYMHDIMRNSYGNPSSIYEQGRVSRVIVEDARLSIANLLGVSPAEIFFTSGGTEAINTIIAGILQNNDVKRVITSPIEHSAMLSSIEYYADLYNKPVEFIPVNEKGQIDIEDLNLVLTKDNTKALVSLMHINN